MSGKIIHLSWADLIEEENGIYKIRDKQEYDVIIGIDPGVNMGYAEYTNTMYSPYRNLNIFSFWELIKFIESFEHCNKLFIVENPNLNKPTFYRNTNQRGMNKISQNVGSNKRDAQLIIEYLKMNNQEVIEVKPTSRKWDAKECFEKTGVKKCSQHCRDAIKLIYEYLQAQKN